MPALVTATSLPVRMLLSTDGSLTSLLEAAFGAPVEVETPANLVDHRLPTPLELELEPGRPVLWRRSGLSVAGEPVLRASAALALDRFDTRACCALLEGREPIGRILRDVETRRELLAIAEHDAGFERTTRIIGGGRPLAIVTERIPASIFDSLE
jgi:chorismate-pyruvate lyase